MSEVTILCYMNGDNDLAQEVLHALDMMETAVASDKIRVIALVDGHAQYIGPYDGAWCRTRLVQVQPDTQTGRIASPVLEEWGEADLGDPRTLTRFIRTARSRFPARRYLFYTFAHGQGVINTRAYGRKDQVKSVAMSRDDTSGGRELTLHEFHTALKKGLNGDRFDMMVLFSCLANMVEIHFELSDVTRYVVSSQDEIRLVNRPPGRYQIRGLHFERLIDGLNQNPAADLPALGRALVDSHVNAYDRDIQLPLGSDTELVCRYAGDMTIVDTQSLPALVQAMDQLARQLIRHKTDDRVLQAVRSALAATPSFKSFLNLEYYDLQRLITHLRAGLRETALLDACNRILQVVSERAVTYGRCTPGSAASGMSFYFPNPLVPDNIFQTHLALYRDNRFSRETLWDDMIQALRPELKRMPVPVAASSAGQK